MLRVTVFRLLACCMLLSVISACSSESGNSTAIVTNEVVLAKSADSYQEVRHIVLRGANREIGRAIAQLAIDYYKAEIMPFSSPQYKSRRDSSIRQYSPTLAERQKGVTAYYGWDDSDLYDSSALWYDMQPVACSAIFFPKTSTANGHSLQARNMDFYVVDMHQFMHPKGQPGRGNKLFSRNFVMETYPQDGGYASLVVGNFDLLNGVYDGFNEYGLSVSGLVDHDLTSIVQMSDLEKQDGLNYLQMMKAILEGASSVDTAKQLVSDMKVYFPVAGMHFLISDSSGKSTIMEYFIDDKGELSHHFVDQTSADPVIMTNHSVFNHQTIDDVRQHVKNDTPLYDSFYRYVRLYDYLQASPSHKYTPDDGLDAMSRVYGFTNDHSEGTTYDLPLRTLWSMVMDLDDLSMKIKFYTADDNTLKTPVFSDAYTFRLRK